MSKEIETLLDKYRTQRLQIDNLTASIDELEDDIASIETRIDELEGHAHHDPSELQRAKDKVRHLRAEATRKRSARRSQMTELAVTSMRLQIAVAEAHGVDFCAVPYGYV